MHFPKSHITKMIICRLGGWLNSPIKYNEWNQIYVLTNIFFLAIIIIFILKMYIDSAHNNSLRYRFGNYHK